MGGNQRKRASLGLLHNLPKSEDTFLILFVFRVYKGFSSAYT